MAKRTGKGAMAKPVHYDVAGQPGGPHPDIQARVDAEQREIMTLQAKAREPHEKAELAARNAKLEKALAAQAEKKSLVATVKALTKRIEALEAKNG